MNKREKIYLIGIILLGIFLVVKAFYLDEYKPATKDEVLFKEYVEHLSAEKYSDFFEKNKFFSIKVVSIKKLEDEGISIIEVKNKENNEYEMVEIQGKYRAKLRKYLLNFIPYGEDKILSRN